MQNLLIKQIIILATFFACLQGVSAQKDSFWLRNLNLMGEPKAVFVLDDGYSIVLADSFDQQSQQYKGIIFFKLDPKGKTVIRKQLFKLDSPYLEQRIERVDLVNNYLLVKAYHILLSDSNIQHTTFNKLDFNGIQFFKTPTKIERYWIAGDTLIHHIHWQKILYWNINDFSIIDSIPYEKAISWNFLNDLEKTFTEIYAKNIKDKYDSLVILKRTLKLDTLRLFTKFIYNKELIRPTPYFKFIGSDYLFLSYKRELVKTDTNLNILWQTPPEFIEAIDEEIVDLKILANGDVLVIGNTMGNGYYIPYFTSVSHDGQKRKFQYAFPAHITKYHAFDEGAKRELFFLVSNPNEIYLGKASAWGQINSIEKNDKQLSSMSIYPNPIKGILNIKLKKPSTGAIKIINAKGQIMLEQRLNNSSKAIISLSELTKGHYYLMFYEDSGIIHSQKFVHI